MAVQFKTDSYGIAQALPFPSHFYTHYFQTKYIMKKKLHDFAMLLLQGRHFNYMLQKNHLEIMGAPFEGFSKTI